MTQVPTRAEDNRFEDFFTDPEYVRLKNHLYNYRLRQRAIRGLISRAPYSLILEIGSGLSPIMIETGRIVYSDLSFNALKNLRAVQKLGHYVVADATRLPFRSEAFSHVIASEVIEHVPEDKQVLREASRVLVSGGKFFITFPHQKFYFGIDDEFVKHLRRYKLVEVKNSLSHYDFEILRVKKILGPLDKIAMCLAVACFSTLKKTRGNAPAASKKKIPAWLGGGFKLLNDFYMVLAWLDSKLMPRFLSAILLIEAGKK